MLGAAHRGNQYFGCVIIICINAANLLDQPHAVLADIIKPANKRRNKAGAGFCRKQRLTGCETQRYIDFCAGVAERATGLQSGSCQWHFHRNIWRNRRQFPAFSKHCFIISGGDLGAHRPINHSTDFGDSMLNFMA